MSTAVLAFADGTHFWGNAIGKKGTVVAEVVFNTAMTGYQEVLTDPSYAGQMICFTAPHIGNVGINTADWESSRVWAKALITRCVTSLSSHWEATQTLPEWLEQEALVGITDIDTRGLTQYLRDQGAQMGCVMSVNPTLREAIALAQLSLPMQGQDLTTTVTRYVQITPLSSLPEKQINQPPHIIVYDFGVKQGILNALSHRNCAITLVPAMTTAQEVFALKPDGIVFSNGPGDPAACLGIIQEIKTFVSAHIPLLGICLGHQLLALACGGQTLKMPFGHHGINHPIQSLVDQKVHLTTQNHTFAVDEPTLPPALMITHRSLFDGTIQGLRHRHAPVISVQGHPEARPGPHDTLSIFDDFLDLIAKVT